MINSEKDQELFDRIAAGYSRKDAYPPSAGPRRAQLFTVLAPLLKSRGRFSAILELGCGVGAPARYLAGRYGFYYGVDYSRELIALAEKTHQGNNIRFFAADIKKIGDLPFDLNSINLVLFVGVLHHMAGLPDFLNNLPVQFRPGTDFVFIEPNGANPFFQLLRLIRKKIDKNYSVDQVFFKKSELAGLLSTAGFKEAVIAGQGVFSPPFAQVILRPEWLFGPLSRLAVLVDGFIYRAFAPYLNIISWDLIVRAKN